MPWFIAVRLSNRVPNSFILPDHLGSASVITDATGLVLSEMAYWPYGATRSGGISQTDKRYTGQQEEPGDAALGLYNYKARFYSTTLGRFMSADGIVPSSDPQALNRYSYVLGNPLKYIDPDGRCFTFFGTKLECSRQLVLQVLRCGIGVETGCSRNSAVTAMGRAALSQSEFWRNYRKYMNEGGGVSIKGGPLAGVPLESAVLYSLFEAASEGGRPSAITGMGWKEISSDFGVESVYFARLS